MHQYFDEMEQRQAVVEEAMTWLGTPYHHRARVKGAGVDCGQLLAAVFEAAGVVPAIDPGDYPPDWHCHRGEERYLGFVQEHARPLPDGAKPRPGDVVLYRFGRCISHGAIVINWPTVLHSYVRQGVILDDAEANQELAPRQVGVWSVWASAGGEA